MKRFLKKHKQVFIVIVCLLIVAAMVLGPMAMFFAF